MITEIDAKELNITDPNQEHWDMNLKCDCGVTRGSKIKEMGGGGGGGFRYGRKGIKKGRGKGSRRLSSSATSSSNSSSTGASAEQCVVLDLTTPAPTASSGSSGGGGGGRGGGGGSSSSQQTTSARKKHKEQCDASAEVRKDYCKDRRALILAHRNNGTSIDDILISQMSKSESGQRVVGMLNG